MKKAILFFATAAIALAAFGCSGGGDAPASSTTPAGDTTSTAPAVGETKTGGPVAGPEPMKPPGS